MEQFLLTDKIIIITGASSGIGQATARLCAKAGAKIILLGRNEERLKATYESLEGEGHLWYSIDLSDFSLLQKFVNEDLKGLNIIHGIVHAAGVTSTYPFRLIKMEHMDSYFKINVYAAFQLSRLLLKKAKVQGASFVFVTSVMASVGEKAKSLYSMTKGAVLSGARSLALELSGQNIRVNCVSPGVVNTPMTENANYKRDPKLYQAMLEKHPLGFGDAEDVANAVLFLLSDASSWMTGTDIKVDGGYTAQ